jgi:hypothetical protein
MFLPLPLSLLLLALLTPLPPPLPLHLLLPLLPRSHTLPMMFRLCLMTLMKMCFPLVISPRIQSLMTPLCASPLTSAHALLQAAPTLTLTPALSRRYLQKLR